MLVTITMGLSSFSTNQVLKTIDDAKNEKDREKDKVNEKLDLIFIQIGSLKSGQDLMNYQLSEKSKKDAEQDARIKELENELARMKR